MITAGAASPPLAGLLRCTNLVSLDFKLKLKLAWGPISTSKIYYYKTTEASSSIRLLQPQPPSLLETVPPVAIPNDF